MMIKLQGKYNEAIVYTDNVESSAMSQIIELCNQEFVKESKIRIMPDCLTEDTEVLTDMGFKLIKELNPTALIANVDSNSFNISFSRPKNIIIRNLRDGEKVYSYKNEALNIEIKSTENHRNAYISKMGEITKNLPENIAIKDLLWCGNKTNSFLDMSDDVLKLICWIIGDGSIKTTKNPKSINYRIVFGLKKERKIKDILFLLDKCNLEYSVSKTDKQTTIMIDTKSSKPLLEILKYKKEFPMEWISKLSADQIKLILEEYVKIDGDYEAYISNKGMRINSNNVNTINFMTSISSLSYGLSMSINRGILSESYENSTNAHYVNIVSKNKLLNSPSGFGNRKLNKKELIYTGKVVCITCNSGFFIARQNGRTFVTGNCHAGAGCTIGTTMTIIDKIVPNLVGVDIGCGVEVAIINKHKNEVNFDQLDEVIHKFIPHGFDVRSNSSRHPYSKKVNFRDIRAPFNLSRAKDSIGTLGGGNHFIELNELEDKIVLTVHSGSRHLGKQIAEYYQKHAYDELNNVAQEKAAIVARLKEEGRHSEIEKILQTMPKRIIQKDLAYVEGQTMNDYLNDMKIAQQYATFNRKAIIEEITTRMSWEILDDFTTIHNYIDLDQMILRKGAISAKKGERVVIPINMRDGSIIAIGKGNSDWNHSGPHGAGRIMSRGKAKEEISFEDFKETMKNVWSTSISISTLDESPMAYKDIGEIIENISDTVDIVDIIKPIYNFKSS